MTWTLVAFRNLLRNFAANISYQRRNFFWSVKKQRLRMSERSKSSSCWKAKFVLSGGQQWHMRASRWQRRQCPTQKRDTIGFWSPFIAVKNVPILSAKIYNLQYLNFKAWHSLSINISPERALRNIANRMSLQIAMTTLNHRYLP